MAFRLKRLASIPTLSSVSRMVCNKTQTRKVENLLAPRLESAIISSNWFSRDQKASNHGSTEPDKYNGMLFYLCRSGVCENVTKTVLLVFASVLFCLSI